MITLSDALDLALIGLAVMLPLWIANRMWRRVRANRDRRSGRYDISQLKCTLMPMLALSAVQWWEGTILVFALLVLLAAVLMMLAALGLRDGPGKAWRCECDPARHGDAKFDLASSSPPNLRGTNHGGDGSHERPVASAAVQGEATRQGAGDPLEDAHEHEWIRLGSESGWRCFCGARLQGAANQFQPAAGRESSPSGGASAVARSLADRVGHEPTIVGGVAREVRGGTPRS